MAKVCSRPDCKRGTYGEFCMLHKKRKAIAAESKTAKKKRLHTRKVWFLRNHSDENGHWECYLQISSMCPIQLTVHTIQLEHVEPKVKNPELKYKVRNIKPACKWCNKLKGSQTIEQLSVNFPHLKSLV